MDTKFRDKVVSKFDRLEGDVEQMERKAERFTNRLREDLVQESLHDRCPCDREDCVCREILPWLGFLGLSYGAGWVVSLFMHHRAYEWFQTLNQPVWAPPEWIFPLVCTVMHFLLGTAMWLAWRKMGCHRISHLMALFIVFLILKVGWSYCFFHLQSPFAGFVDLLWAFGAIVLLAISMAPIHRLGAILLIPEILWTGYLLILNWSFWRLN